FGRGQRVAPAPAAVPAASHAAFVVAEVAVLVAAAERDAEAAVGEGLGKDAREFAGPLLAAHRAGQVAHRPIVHRLEADAGQGAGVERACGADVDGRADAAGGRRRAAGLVDLHRRDRLGGQVGEVEGARV